MASYLDRNICTSLTEGTPAESRSRRQLAGVRRTTHKQNPPLPFFRFDGRPVTQSAVRTITTKTAPRCWTQFDAGKCVSNSVRYAYLL